MTETEIVGITAKSLSFLTLPTTVYTPFESKYERNSSSGIHTFDVCPNSVVLAYENGTKIKNAMEIEKTKIALMINLMHNCGNFFD
ncbi:MAG: hypothetical protein OEM28_13510 [Nitrosopumilus sp.]|nr:hypothetical protein [Nitrosopumilus sp.]